MGRRRALSETYGGGGWDLRFEDMKRLGDWEYAHGINFMNQHLSFSDASWASRKYDFPQSFGEHDPWWGHTTCSRILRAPLAGALSARAQRHV